MSREIRELSFSEGVVTTSPDQRFIKAGGLNNFSSYTEFVTAKGTLAEEGDIFYNTTDHALMIYSEATWVDEIEADLYNQHTSNTTTAHGINNIVDSVTALGTTVTDHINNVVDAHGIDDIVLSVTALGTTVYDHTVDTTTHGTTSLIVGADDTLALTNKTIDGDLNTIQDVALTSLKVDASNTNIFVKRGDSGNVENGPAIPSGTLASSDNAISFSNKTIDGDSNTIQDLALSTLKVDAGNTNIFIKRDNSGNVANGPAIPVGAVLGGDSPLMIKQQSTITNADANYNKLYPKADDKWYSKNSIGTEIQVGSGGGAGDADTISLINPNDLPDATTTNIDIQGNNAAFDGGGTITADSLTISSTAGDLIYNAKVIKYLPGANGQNDYFGFTKTIPLGIRGNNISFQFWYKTTATTNDNDFRFCVKIKDGALANTIQYFNLANANTIGVHYAVVFFIPADCTEVEFGIQNTDTTTTVGFNWDQILISSSAFVTTSLNNITDWVAYTPSFTGFGSPTSVNFKSRRVGDTLEIEGYFINGTPTATEARISLGYNGIDSNVTSSSTYPTVQWVGAVGSTDLGGTVEAVSSPFSVIIGASRTYFTFGGRRTGSTSLTEANANALFSASEAHSFVAKVRIEGWKSQTSVATPATTGVENYTLTQAGNALTNMTAAVQFDFAGTYTATKDGSPLTYANWQSSATNLIYVDNSGDPTKFYASKPVTVFVTWRAAMKASSDATTIYNGTTVVGKGTTVNSAGFSSTGSATLHLNAGEYFSVGSDDELYNDTTSVYLSFTAVNYQSAFLASIPAEKVAIIKDVKSSTTGGGTYTAAGWQTRVLNTLEGDTDFIAITTGTTGTDGTGTRFTLQPGKYVVACQAPGYRMDYHRAGLYNVSTSAMVALGSIMYAANPAETMSHVNAVFTLTSANVFELQHQGSAGGANFLGTPWGNGELEVYSQCTIRKLPY